MLKKFQKRQENFACENCKTSVIGNGYTDHCPNCLYGKHVDIYPGDRLEECHGLLAPIAILERKGVQTLEYQCLRCGEISKNRLSEDDSQDALLNLAKTLAKKWSH